MNKCLLCATPNNDGGTYHHICSRRFFGAFSPPTLEISLKDIREYAVRSVLARATVTGVQKKLSVTIEGKGKEARFTIVGLWGGYILKPPVDEYPFLPENEHTIMRCASIVDIPVVPHALISLASGEPAYICKRMDRTEIGEKIAMEDFCQITERLTEDKYKGSAEHTGKYLRRFSVYPGLDAVDFFERVVFNFICGNADMHLKNYSLIETPAGMRLSPAYDLLSTVLAIPEDTEESALTINGKKTGLEKRDFSELSRNLRIPEKVCANIYNKYLTHRQTLHRSVMEGFLPDTMKKSLCACIEERIQRLAG